MATPDTEPFDEARMKRNLDKMQDAEWKDGIVVGKSPQIIDYVDRQSQGPHKVWVSPRWNNEVFERDGVHKVFFLILLLIVIGEFFRWAGRQRRG